MQESVSTDRHKYIGGSDIPIIMGISPFKSRYDLLLEKAELKDNDFKGNQYTEYGNTMEPKIRDYINIIVNKGKNPYSEGKHTKTLGINSDNGFKGGKRPVDVRVHTDGENEDAILEIKTTSQIKEDVDSYKVYLVQLLFYMYVTEKPNGVLAVYERPEDLDEAFNNERLHLYTIEAKDYEYLIEDMLGAVSSFMEDLEKVKANPFITEAELVPQDLSGLANHIVQLEDRLASYKKIESQIKEEKEQLRQAMLDNNVKSWETPNHIKVTLVADTPEKTVVQKVFNEDKLKETRPEIYDSYLEEKEVTKRGRKGYVKITLPKEA